MARQTTSGPLAARLVLTLQLVAQIFLTPLVAFALTYLLVFNVGGGELSINVDVNMIPWIGIASLFYGMLALTLALGMGGFLPNTVIEHGGWRHAMGLSRNARNSTNRYLTRKKYRHQAGHTLWAIRGSLVLLAVPFQVLLATIPLALVLLFPRDLIHQNRQLELALLLYAICLFCAIRMFPYFARKYISLASLARKFLGATMKITWIFPVFLLWSMGQFSTWVVHRWMGKDLSLNIQFEKELFESLISAGPIPETSFLNLLTALAVMPMAAFTTLAVLGGGSGSPPEWMRASDLDDAEDLEQTAVTGSLVNRLAAATDATTVVHTPSVVQQVIVPVAVPSELVHHAERPTPSMIQEPSSPMDGINLDLFEPELGSFIDEEEPQTTSSHNDAVIRGFEALKESK